MPLGYPFFTDDEDLYANLAEPALPPLQATPASPAAPSFSSTSIFQDPEFLKLQSQFPQETEDDIVRRRNLRESALNGAFFDDLSSIALGKAPNAESALRSSFAEQDRGRQRQKQQDFQGLLDAYTKLQGAQSLNSERQNKAYLQWAQNNPTSDISKKRQEQFLNDIESYKNSAIKNAGISGESEEEVAKVLSVLDAYAQDVQNKSYADLERLDASLLKKANLDTQGSRSYAIANAGRSKSELDERKAALEEKKTQAQLENLSFEQRLALAKFQAEKDKAARAAEKDLGKLKLTHDQNKLMGELSDNEFRVNQVDSLIDSIEKLQADPKTAGTLSGWFTGRKNAIKNMFNQTTNQKLTDLGATLTRLFSIERKTFAGSNVTPAEFETLAPMIPNLRSDSENAIIAKLKAAKRHLLEKNAKSYQQIAYDADGNPIDQSLIASRVASTAHNMAANDDFISKYYPEFFSKAQKSPQKSQGKDPKIQKYADEHFNGDYDLAAKILSQRK